MGTVIPFRRGAARPDETKARESRATAARHAREALRATGGGLLRMIRFVAFLLLLTLRRPVVGVLRFVGAVLIFGLLLIWFGASGPEKARLLWMAGGGSIAAIALAWFYDTLLMRLAPEPIILT